MKELKTQGAATYDEKQTLPHERGKRAKGAATHIIRKENGQTPKPTTGSNDTYTAGEAIKQGQPVHKRDDGLLYISDNDPLATLPAIGIASRTVALNEKVTIINSGQIENNDLATPLTPLLPVYITNGGDYITTTTPTATNGKRYQTIGHAITASEYVIKIGISINFESS